jgi:energy-coupling factor transport system substrate-specific component
MSVETPTDKPMQSGLKGWSTQDLLVTAVVGIVFGLLIIPIHMFIAYLEMLAGPIVSRSLVGVFFVPGLMALYITRRPGAAIIATLISSLVQVPLSPQAWAVLSLVFVNGIPMELPFLVTRYRNYSTAMMVISGALVAIPNYVARAAVFGYLNLSPVVVIVAGVMTMASAAFWGGWLSKVLADAIAKTGVLSGFAIGQAQQEEI